MPSKVVIDQVVPEKRRKKLKFDNANIAKDNDRQQNNLDQESLLEISIQIIYM